MQRFFGALWKYFIRKQTRINYEQELAIHLPKLTDNLNYFKPWPVWVANNKQQMYQWIDHWALIYLEEALASSFALKPKTWRKLVPVRAISDTLRQIGPSTVREFFLYD